MIPGEVTIVTEFIRTFTSEEMSELGKRGGRSRSERKRETARENIKKAIEARRTKRLTIAEEDGGQGD